MASDVSQPALALPGRARAMPPHSIREVMDLAWAVPDAIHLEVGEPDFPTPDHIVDAAVRALREGQTKYTPNAGVPELRAALAEKIERANGYRVEAGQVVVTAGGVEALYSTLLALVEPGDEVLLPDPSWPNFSQMVHLLGARARFYSLVPAGRYQPRLDELERLVTDKTKVLILNSPSNPLGSIIPAELLVELVEFAERNGLWVISDECYDEISFDGGFASTQAVAPSEHVVSVYSFSKVYAMTGWRVGYAVCPAPLAAQLTKLQEPIISCVNAPAQAGALAALMGPQDVVERMRLEYRSRRNLVLDVFARAGLPALRPSGAFYVWVDISASGRSGRDFAHALIENEHVAVAPGSAFGTSGDGAVRLSLAASADNLLEGAGRMARSVFGDGDA